MKLRRLLVSREHQIVLVIVESVALASRDYHIAEIVCVNDFERSHAMGCEGLQVVLGLLQVVVADCRVSVVLGRLTVHLEGFNLSGIGLAI